MRFELKYSYEEMKRSKETYMNYVKNIIKMQSFLQQMNADHGGSVFYCEVAMNEAIKYLYENMNNIKQ